MIPLPPEVQKLLTPTLPPVVRYVPIYFDDTSLGTVIDTVATGLQTLVRGVRLIAPPSRPVEPPEFDHMTGVALKGVLQLYDGDGPPVPIARPLVCWRPTDPIDIQRYICGPFTFSHGGVYVACVPAGHNSNCG
jgi:hypothetical protein